jgi:molybdate transport system permease protein
MHPPRTDDSPDASRKAAPTRSDAPFYVALGLLGGLYVFLIAAMLVADLFFTSPLHLLRALNTPEIRYSINLSLVSCSASASLSMLVAVPLGYLLSRTQFRGKTVVDTLLDIPIVLPPLVVGLSLLILFRVPPLRYLPITFQVPAVILAQFSVAAAFAVRTMRVTFDQISPRTEQVALTLGCTRFQAFYRVVLPEARRGMLTAGTLAWARSLGEFGPILIFAGATPMKTEVLSTSVYLAMTVGNLETALAVSLLMVIVAVVVLVITRAFGMRENRVL